MALSKAKKVLAITILVSIILAVLFIGVNTSWGAVDVKVGKLMTDNGTLLNYKLYVPKTATANTPAPAVLYGVGGGDGLDAGRSFGIEASRRGYVVMSIDIAGNGLSEVKSTSVSFDSSNAIVSVADPTYGYETAYQWLSSLAFVDGEKMITGGHSLGAIGTVIVAQNHQEDVKLQFNVGAMTYGSPENGYDFNFAFILGSSDESALVRTSDHGTMSEVLNNDTLKLICGLAEDETIEAEKIYGDFSNGTGRILKMPHTFHFSAPYKVSILTDFLECLDMATDMPNHISSDNTVFQYTYAIMVGMIIAFTAFITSVGCVLLDTETFKSLKLAPRKYIGFRPNTTKWRIAVLILTIACGYTAIYSQQIMGSGATNFFSKYGNAAYKCLWSLFTGGTLLVYMIVFYAISGKKQELALADYGVATGDDNGFHIGYILKTILLAVVVFAIAMGYFLGFYYVTKSNISWVVFEIDPIPAQRAGTRFLAMMLWMLPFVFMNAIAQRTVINLDEDSTKSTIKALLLSNLISCLTILVIHLVFIGTVYMTQHVLFSANRGYIGGQQIMGLVVGTFVINTAGFFMNKKTNTVWSAVLSTLFMVAWFQVTASNMTF